MKSQAATSLISWVMLTAAVATADAQSVFRQPVDLDLIPFSTFFPTAVAAAPDGSIYVAEDSTETIQRYDASGSLIDLFDSPVRGLNERITDLAVNSQGDLYVTWSDLQGNSTGFFPRWNTALARPGGNGGVSHYSTGGQLLSTWEFAGSGLTSVAIGPDDRVFVGADRMIAEVGSAGQLQPLVDNGLFSLAELEYSTSDSKLYATTNTDVVAYDLQGQRIHAFSVANPILYHNGFTPPERVTAMTVAQDGLWVTDSQSGSVRKYSLSGELLDIGYGVTRTEGLAVSPDGSLIAAMPQSRSVERIGAERFDPNYGGVTLISENNRQLVEGPSGLLGVDLSRGWKESPAATFIIPGSPGETVDVSFRFTRSSESVMSVFPVASVTADPTVEPMEYMRQALEGSFAHLRAKGGSCTSSDLPECSDTVSIEAGTEIGFMHLREFWSFIPHAFGSWQSTDPGVLDESARETFEILADLTEEEYAALMAIPLGDDLRIRSLQPFVSDSRANWGRMDQFAFFLGEDSTFLAMEDLSQAGFSDLSYHDATLLIDVRLIPVPEPASIAISALALSFLPRRR